ncbi:alkaline phosphatase family protein [Wenjunlia tyrosinilytica]|uniref:Alkaline phosphatase family protein n=1 Tax=Wenjunlia tyrosinilytica TaxID=1544741 RepID=A0A917ZQR0_9ACTN|nr:nucleotide pyrophosphatase/phosphodiesterase family protein [Wenjunlia tyrosinilytica]GGO87604.1 alkaline phosphatase family protein [Wenjunlia tyrosinilytica]
MRRLLVVNAVGLTPRLLPHMPRLRALRDQGFGARLDTVLPAVTCSVQSTLLTGEPPSVHGVVGNGWYFRELGEVLLWRQHNQLVGGEKIWETARRRRPGYSVANICWWYAMGADVDWTVTPRPIYYADGRKEPDCYTFPPSLHDELTNRLGDFPLFRFWGPAAGIASSQWIVEAARHVFRRHRPDLCLVYLPHLDYDLQRHGPHSRAAVRAARELDRTLAPLLDDAHRVGARAVVLSEYGITPVSRPVDINRELRRAGLLQVHTQGGMEYLDPWTSRAFAVADHQIAHLYVRDPADVPRVCELLRGIDGVAEVLGDTGKKDYGIDHPRAGELVAMAAADAWFTYYYWLEDKRAPDFARLVEIHRKPGYDPAELLFDHTDRLVRIRAAAALARKKLGFRYAMKVVSLDPSRVRGSHGRLPASADDAPVLLASDASHARDVIAAAEVKELLLELAGLAGPTGPAD